MSEEVPYEQYKYCSSALLTVAVGHVASFSFRLNRKFHPRWVRCFDYQHNPSFNVIPAQQEINICIPCSYIATADLLPAVQSPGSQDELINLGQNSSLKFSAQLNTHRKTNMTSVWKHAAGTETEHFIPPTCLWSKSMTPTQYTLAPNPLALSAWGAQPAIFLNNTDRMNNEQLSVVLVPPERSARRGKPPACRQSGRWWCWMMARFVLSSDLKPEIWHEGSVQHTRSRTHDTQDQGCLF